MADIATLGIQIDASGVPRAVKDLQALEQAGAKAEAATQKLGAASRQASTEAQKMADAQARADSAHQAHLRQRAANEQRAAAERTAKAAENGRKSAQADADAQEAVYRSEIAHIKAAQARGFLTPAESAKAGRESARAFNQARLATLDRGTAVGAFRGAEGQAVFSKLAGDLKNVEESGKRAGLGLNSLREPLTTVTFAAAGANPAFGRFASVLSSFAFGSAITVGILAGLAAITLAFAKLTEGTRKAKEEAEAARNRLQEAADARRLGVTGQLENDLRAERDAVAKLEERRRQAAGRLALGSAGDDNAVAASAGARRELANLEREIQERNAIILENEKRLGEELGELRTSAAERQGKEAAEAFARATRSIVAKPFTDVARGLAEIGRVQEQIDALKFAEPYEQGAKAANEMREEIAKLEERLKALQAAVPENVRRALDPASIGFRAADFQGVASGNRGGAYKPIRAPGITGFNSSEAAQERQVQVDAINEAHKSGISRGFAAAKQVVSDLFANAFSAANIGAGIAQSIGERLLSAAASGLSDLGDRISGKRAEEQAAETRRQVDAMERLTAAIREWGDKVAGLSAFDIGRFSQLNPNNVQFRPGKNGPDLVGQDRAVIDDLVEFFGLDFGESIDPGEWMRLLEAWNRAFAEAQRITQEAVTADIKQRRAALSGDTVGVATLHADAEQQAKVAEATKLLNQQLIDQALFMELVQLAAQEYTKALEEINAAEAARVEQLRREKEAFEGDLRVRLLAAQGREAEATALRDQLAQQAEMADAVTRFGEGIRDLVLQVHEAENAARAAAAAEAAKAEAERIAAAQRQLDMDLAVREAQLRGDSEATIRAQFEQRSAQEMEAARAAGATNEQLARLAAVLDGELNQALANAAKAAADAARALSEDFTVRSLAVGGFEREANVARFDFGQSEELRRISESGATQATIDQWKGLLSSEREKFIQGLDRADFESAASAALAAAPKQEERSIAAMAFASTSSQQFASASDIWRSQLSALRNIETYTRSMARGTFGVPSPDFTGGAVPTNGTTVNRITVNLTVNGTVTPDALPALKTTVTSAIIDAAMGGAFNQAERAGGSTAI